MIFLALLPSFVDQQTYADGRPVATLRMEGFEYTDAFGCYWSQDLNHWNPSHKAVVLDGTN